jgi:hypothetical protein
MTDFKVMVGCAPLALVLMGGVTGWLIAGGIGWSIIGGLVVGAVLGYTLLALIAENLLDEQERQQQKAAAQSKN